MAEIELHPGTPFCSAAELNRIARQQGLCLAIAQASIFDEICQAMPLPEATETELVQRYLEQNDCADPTLRDQHLASKGWSLEDLTYFASKQERLHRFQQQMFTDDVEVRFLDRKSDLDQISYSLIRLRDGDLAFELHQRLLEGEADFATLAAAHSEGPEREHQGRVGPVPLSQAHQVLVDKLRTSRPGQLWTPFFLKDIWVILRLDHWEGARLDAAMRETLLDELFEQWLERRVDQLLAGQTPDPLPLHLLERL